MDDGAQQVTIDELRLIAERLGYEVIGEGDGVVRFAPAAGSEQELVAFPEHPGFIDQVDVVRVFVEAGLPRDRARGAINAVLMTENAA